MNIAELYGDNSKIITLVNINAVVKFQLSKRGKEINESLPEYSKFIPDPETGIVTSQLWTIMQTFGSYISMIEDSPFRGNIITILPSEGCVEHKTIGQIRHEYNNDIQ